jgi:hypothetical protein
VPPRIALFQQLTLFLRDAVLEAQFDKEFSGLVREVDARLGDRPLGYLLLSELYSDEHGAPIIPSGQLIYPIGVGREPTDALAEHIRGHRLQVPRPKWPINHSTYLWIRKRDGKLGANVMARQGRASFERGAREEARRRDLLADPHRYGTKGIAAVKRAEFWATVAQTHSNQIRAKERQATLDDLLRRFTASQDAFNHAFGAYRTAEEELSRRQALQATLGHAAAVLDVISAAVKVQALTSSNGRPASDAADPRDPISAAQGRNSASLDQIRSQMQRIETELQRRGHELESFDLQFRAVYREENVAIPRVEPLTVPSTKLRAPN